MTKYIVSGYIGFDNFGDEAIQKVLTEKLKSEGAEKITLISSNPIETEKLYQVCSCGMFEFIKPMLDSDVLISGGGSLLQDVTSFKSLLYYLSVIYSAYLFNKKVEIYAQGIGPIKSKIGNLLTKIALKNASKITVRDKESKELLEKWGIQSELVNDPILDINFINKNLTGTVGIQLRNFRSLSDKFLYNLANEIKTRFYDKKIKIISLQDDFDLEVGLKFKEMLNSIGMNDIEIKQKLNVNEVIEELTGLEYLIAMRFHACVIGAKANIKTLCINYDPKVEKLAKEFNLPYINLSDDNLKQSFDILIN